MIFIEQSEIKLKIKDEIIFIQVSLNFQIHKNP